MAGIDVHGADVAQREPFAFSEEQATQLMTSVVSHPGVHGAVLLTTCNRTELYLSMEPDAGIMPPLLRKNFPEISSGVQRQRSISWRLPAVCTLRFFTRNRS